MTTVSLSLHELRHETAKQGNLLLAAALCTGLLLVGGPAAVPLFAATTAAAVAAHLLLERRPGRLALIAVIAVHHSLILASPWFSGGIRQPLALLEAPLLLLAGFLVGTRAAFWLATGFSVNAALLAAGEHLGWITGRPPDATTHVVMLAAGATLGLSLIARPLGITQDLLERSREAKRQKIEHQQRLEAMKTDLDRRIAERERELATLQGRLHVVTENLTSTSAPMVQRIALRARFLLDTFRDRDETVRFPVQRIAAACERLTTMHDSLSRFSLLGPAGLHPRDLDTETIRSMVRGIWDDIRIHYPRAGHRLFLSELRGCRADPDLLRQVWQHLLSNAAKFSARQAKPRIVVGWKDGSFYVNDNGAGFDMDKARDLFELFSRQHPAGEYPGDGIGLALAKRIAELHKGDLHLESEPGRGTTAWLRLD